MTHASSTIRIDVPAATIWSVISEFGAAVQYLVMVVACTVEGQGIGARRTLKSVDGSTIVECLDALDTAAQYLSYTLLTDTPFRDCVTTMVLRYIGPNQTDLVWSATFEADGLPANEAAALLEGALAANCRALKGFIEQGGR